MTAFGAHFVYDGAALDRDQLARLLVDSRWPAAMPLLQIRPVPGSGALVEKRKLGNPNGPKETAAKVAAEIAEALTSDTTLEVGLTASRSERNNDAWVYVDAGRDPVPDGRYPYSLGTFARNATEDWLELVHALAVCIDAAHGSILASREEDEPILRSELWAQHESYEGREVHPDPGLITALALKRYGLGDRWVRPARCGTYLSPAHVTEIGGQARIAALEPAVLRELGPSLLYVQLSPVKDALTSATRAKQEAFEQVLKPLTIPR